MTRAFRLCVIAGWGACLGLFGAGCRDEQAGPRPKAPRTPPPSASATTAARTLDAAPDDLTHRSGATLAGGAVTYLGSKVTPLQARPGGRVTLAHYFVAQRPPPEGYSFFVHLVDPTSGRQLGNADHEIGGGALPLGRWPVGKVVEDVHTLQAPQGEGEVRVMLGFWRGDERLPVDDPAAHDGQQRLIGPTFKVGERAPLPEYRVPRVDKPPRIDGLLDDAAWKRAPEATLVGSFDGRATQLRTTARLVHDGKNLFIAFDVEDPDVWGTFRTRDEALYTQEVVEVFLDANGDGKTYNEMQVSPHNVVFDAYFPARRQGMDLTFDAQMETAVKVRGTLDQPGDRDEGWSAELRIPLSRLAEVPRLPPEPGDRWRFNLYRLEHLGRTDVEGQAFSPLFVGDFHALPRFGVLVFE